MTSAGRFYPASYSAEQIYRPIESYGAIGNLRSVGLVGADGSLDWLCFPDLSGGSVFAALLDASRGGRFRVWVEGASTRQRYMEGTNILETAFLPVGGVLTLTDLMPLWGNIHGKGRSVGLPEVHRLLDCRGRDMEVRAEWSPRPDYARAPVEIGREDDTWIARWKGGRLSLCGLPEGRLEETPYGPKVTASFHLKRDEQRAVVTRYGSNDHGSAIGDIRKVMERTAETWQGWVHTPLGSERAQWAREFTSSIARSELALKLLINADTGAIAAAPTTSLPEIAGGDYNWDYRFSWVRDSSMAAQALLALGHPDEAAEYLEWIEETTEASCATEWNPQIMYGINGEKDLTEVELDHLEGYLGSRPVRIGNGAAGQRQLEVYGELMSTGYELMRQKVPLDERTRRFLARAADKVCELWELPDSGIWETRGKEKHYTYSKAMLWVALDRAVHMAEQYVLEGDVKRWRKVGDRIAEVTIRDGYSKERGAFVEHFGGDDLDASNLRIPLMELLPFGDERVQGTIDAIINELLEGGLLHRSSDAVRRKEGTFTLCTFWLVQALALSDRKEEARVLLENVSEVASPLGLFAEMFDPRTGMHLGNYPQAFSHIGFINAVLYLLYAEGQDIPVPEPIGSLEHRTMLGQLHLDGVDRRGRDSDVP